MGKATLLAEARARGWWKAYNRLSPIRMRDSNSSRLSTTNCFPSERWFNLTLRHAQAHRYAQSIRGHVWPQRAVWAKHKISACQGNWEVWSEGRATYVAVSARGGGGHLLLPRRSLGLSNSGTHDPKPQLKGHRGQQAVLGGPGRQAGGPEAGECATHASTPPLTE